MKAPRSTELIYGLLRRVRIKNAPDRRDTSDNLLNVFAVSQKR
jgi:hypothetical protein